MRYDSVLIRFGELWLKGGNRDMFIAALYGNVSKAIRGLKYKALSKQRDAFTIELDGKSDVKGLLSALSYVPGISWFSPVVSADPTIKGIMKKASSFSREAKGKVRVEARRSYKGHKFNSTELVSAMLKAPMSSLKLDLDKDANDTLYITVGRERAFLHLNKITGIGGLPVGTSGRCIVLLSGGIDSPVASFYAMKRGLLPVYVHFHTFPDSGQAERSKIPGMVRQLARYSNGAKAYYIPAHIFQAAAMKMDTRYELVVFKRFMYSVASRIAKREGALSIVTGESVGQVASQTIENMAASQKGIEELIVRPLSGFDKGEIIDKARQLDTYDMSIQDYKDVCSIRIKRPATRATAQQVDRLYKKCGLRAVEGRSIKAALVKEAR